MRSANIYVRQSTPHQVQNNTESTARQYALVDRAIDLGWLRSQVEVIDDDQAISGKTVAGRLGAGSGCDSTRPELAGRDETEPVVSCGGVALRLDAKGFESKRPLSEQPAAAMPTRPRTATRGQIDELARERDGTMERCMWLLTRTLQT